MKLVSLNVEGNNHFKRVHAFLRNERPDVLCLQEAPEYFSQTLRALGYSTAYAPVKVETKNGETYNAGNLIGARLPMVARENYYHGTREVITVHRPDVDATELEVHPYLIATVTDEDGTEYEIATTHLMVTKDGLPDALQRQGAESLLALIDQEQPHVLCGDMNMPRGYNELYEEFKKRYKDEIPAEYKSSLDKNLHRYSNRLDELTAPIFDSYMVDYIFTQAPYEAKNVRLQFGVSDHAAVIGEILKKPN